MTESAHLPRPDRGATEEPVLDDVTLEGALEALLLMAEEPMPVADLAAATRTPVDRVTGVLGRLAAFYDEHHRGFELRQVGGGWRYYTRVEHGALIAGWVLQGQQTRLSQAALETLAVVAYLQPVSRARMSAVRGVSVDGVVRTLTARGLIEEAGLDEATGATVFRTTDHFLERMGLTSLDQLPPLAPHLPDAMDLEAELGRLAAADAARDDGSGENDPEGGVGHTATVPDDSEDADSDVGNDHD